MVVVAPTFALKAPTPLVTGQLLHSFKAKKNAAIFGVDQFPTTPLPIKTLTLDGEMDDAILLDAS